MKERYALPTQDADWQLWETDSFNWSEQVDRAFRSRKQTGHIRRSHTRMTERESQPVQIPSDRIPV
jgi:hypothetical protein